MPFHYFFYVRIIFFSTKLKKGQKMYFLNNYLGGLKTKKMKTDVQSNITELSNLTSL
jgi:hypothetical protein